MHRESLQHFIYGSVIIAITLSLFFYTQSEITQTQQLLDQEVSTLEQDIASANTIISQLTNKVEDLENSLGTVSTQLEEKTTQISNLNKNLAQVKTQSESQIEELEESLKDVKAANADFSDVIEDVIPGVVSIDTNVGSGSGFFVTTSGYVVTNYHVIQGASAGSIVTSKGITHSIRVVGANIKADIAVLHTTGSNFKALTLADSDDVKVGEKVIAVGNPGGLDFSVTQGIVSNTQRFDDFSNQFLQIDVPINPGNSGGPLINTQGEVIGVNTKKILGFEGVGFALVSDQVENIIDEIIEDDQDN